MLRWFPLLLIPIIIYNLFALGGGVIAHQDVQTLLLTQTEIPMFSGDTWKVSYGDYLILLTLVLLFVEVVKASGTSRKEMINNAFSMIVFVVALTEFIVLKGFSTSAFFFITVMCLFDAIGGPTITAVSAKRDIGLGGGVIDAG